MRRPDRRILCQVVGAIFAALCILGVTYRLFEGDGLCQVRSQLLQGQSILSNASKNRDHDSPDASIILDGRTIQLYLDAIFDSSTTDLQRLQCPDLDAKRYESLKVNTQEDSKIEYVFPLNLRQNLLVLPTLMSAIVRAIQYLGPKHCILSIVEGNSPDGTSEVLEALSPRLKELGVTYFYQTTALNPGDGDRIEKLSKLRNAALQPVMDRIDILSPSAIAIFLNDVLACPDDVLELALQLKQLDADMTCAMDWEYGDIARYYDCWIGRGIKGDTFWEFPENMSWDRNQDLFWNEPETKSRLSRNLPFQVFSCWNGGVSFRLKPFIEGLRFRAPNATLGECIQGEPQLMCAEMYYRGYGKIAVVPAVNFGYEKPDFTRIKKQKGFVQELVGNNTVDQNQISWVGPPDQVKCIEPWSKQYWQSWNASFIELDKEKNLLLTLPGPI